MLVLGLAGLGIYLTIWAGNDAAPNPNRVAEWRSCPAWLHGLLRRDAGSVLLTAVMVELAALVMIITALLAYAGVLRPPDGGYAMLGAWVLVLLSFITVEFRARFRV